MFNNPQQGLTYPPTQLERAQETARSFEQVYPPAEPKAERRINLDMVNRPPHYRTGKIEVIDFIDDQKLSYCLGNTVKYICRHKHKGSPLEDLKKARWYLEREIAHWEKVG